jgi:hypothetical protein
MDAEGPEQAALTQAAHRARPVTLAREHVLSVSEALNDLFPEGGLRRGSTLAVTGAAASSLALAMASGPSAMGSWVGVVGLPSLGLLAAAEVGVALERLVLVASPPAPEWPRVVATLLDGVDVVLTRPPLGVRMGAARRLQARARERGAVVVVVGPPAPFEVDLVCAVVAEEWLGLQEGSGHLRARRVAVEVSGRRGGGRPRRGSLWLPDDDGAVRTCEHEATVVTLRGSA